MPPSSPKVELELCDGSGESGAVLAFRKMSSRLCHLGCGRFAVEHDRQGPASPAARPAVNHAQLNWFQCVPASAALRSRAAGAGRATRQPAACLFRTWSSPPCEPRVNASQRGRAPRAPGVADGRCRGSSMDESRFSPLVEFDIRSDDTTAPLANFFHRRMRRRRASERRHSSELPHGPSARTPVCHDRSRGRGRPMGAGS